MAQARIDLIGSVRKCRYCDKTFKSEAGENNHMKRLHPLDMESDNIIIIIYFLPIFELYIFSQRLRCLLLYIINFGETDNRKVSLSAVAVSYPIDVFYPVTRLFTRMPTYVQDGEFKITSKNSNTIRSFHMVELSSTVYSLRIYLRMFPKTL